MKKKSLALLVAAMCLTLSACGAAESNCACGEDCSCRTAETDSTSQESTDDISLESTEDASTEDANTEDTTLDNARTDSLLIETTFRDKSAMCINKDKFGSLVKYIEPTTENWREYFEIRSYDQERITYDAFGEIKDTTTYTDYYMRPVSEEDNYYTYDGFVMELKDKETGTLYTSSYGGDLYDEYYNCKWLENVDLDDYECTRIKGGFYLVDIPEEAITTYSYSEGGETYTCFLIEREDYVFSYDIDTYTNRILTYDYDISYWQEK